MESAPSSHPAGFNIYLFTRAALADAFPNWALSSAAEWCVYWLACRVPERTHPFALPAPRKPRPGRELKRYDFATCGGGKQTYINLRHDYAEWLWRMSSGGWRLDYVRQVLHAPQSAKLDTRVRLFAYLVSHIATEAKRRGYPNAVPFVREQPE